ncbi:hypothetical protein NF212_08570 [Parasalinivibrio latis]|uniref:lipocalin family protein n=1 Tax=Parasalinivibrio latis TaxID=2952610 RepID=UPI0030DE6E6A
MKFIVGVLFLGLAALPAKAGDLTQLDFPLLIGDWYWFSQDQSTTTEDVKDYKALSISFSSEDTFQFTLLHRNGKTERLKGKYSIDESALVLNDEFGQGQQHQYKLSHNKLQLQGISFTKLLPAQLSGLWISKIVYGSDIEKGTHFSINLRPDFLFSAKVNDKQGNQAVHRGIYFLEGENLILLYPDGQQETTFELSANTLTLTDAISDAEMVMERKN